MSRGKAGQSEERLARVIIDWLESQHWDVYQEVEFHDHVADIVAVQGRAVWVVETKTSLTLRVMAQADFWRRRANFVSVGAPERAPCRSDPAYEFATSVMRERGIGLIEVGFYSDLYPPNIRAVESPRLFRSKMAAEIRGALFPEHKTYASAGSSRGGYFTPFKATCEAVRRCVDARPGVQIREVLGEIQHHYGSDATARACLLKWIEAGRLAGVVLVRDGRRCSLYPEGALPDSILQ